MPPRRKWSGIDNREALECHFKAIWPDKLGYRKRQLANWTERRPNDAITEQCLAGQISIISRKYLSLVEQEAIAQQLVERGELPSAFLQRYHATNHQGEPEPCGSSAAGATGTTRTDDAQADPRAADTGTGAGAGAGGAVNDVHVPPPNLDGESTVTGSTCEHVPAGALHADALGAVDGGSGGVSCTAESPCTDCRAQTNRSLSACLANACSAGIIDSNDKQLVWAVKHICVCIKAAGVEDTGRVLGGLVASVQRLGVDERPKLAVPRKIPYLRLSATVAKINCGIRQLVAASEFDLSIEFLNHVAYAAAVLTLLVCGIPPVPAARMSSPQPEVPGWQRRLQRKVDALRKDVSRLTSYLASDNPQMYKRYPVGTRLAAASLLGTKKLELLALAGRKRRYKADMKRKQENQLFRYNERQFYRNLCAKKDSDP